VRAEGMRKFHAHVAETAEKLASLAAWIALADSK